MQEQNNQQSSERNQTPNSLDNAGHGPQGIDKAPGEETPQDTVNFKEETQKGKKVDADLTREEERPLEDQDI